MFSWKVGPISQWLSIFWTLYQNSSSVHSVTLYQILNHSHLFVMHTGKTLPHLVLSFFVFPGHYTHLDVCYLFQLLLSLETGLSSLWIKINLSLGIYVFCHWRCRSLQWGCWLFMFLWDQWELHLLFLLLVVRKYSFLSWKWLCLSSDQDSFKYTIKGEQKLSWLLKCFELCE